MSTICIYGRTPIFVTFLVDTMDAWFKVQLNKKDDTEFGEKLDTKKYKIKTLKATLLRDMTDQLRPLKWIYKMLSFAYIANVL